MAYEIGANARIANPQLKFFERIIGEWRTTGTHPALPGATLRGKVSFAWQDGGAFLVWRSEIEDPLFPDGIAIVGSDDAAGTISSATSTSAASPASMTSPSARPALPCSAWTQNSRNA
ncbi:hypothetical protein [Devosia ginsengisoli]|uniref:hypothetical protein n=1 Tax=Devosia ginsengisoli TaxID=400770 RepID=UPI0026EB7D45|nr:hypothetical protein [Devosia ginsengisoli]MCR6670402.1 hypothetical protein [Devosia ginsengisoli]